MQTENINQQLGKGIYTIPEVSFILKLPVGKVRRWMNDFWDNRLSAKNNTVYSTGKGKDKVTNFYMLIEFYVFYQLRELNVSTHNIFAAHQEMSQQLDSPYPFATSKVLSDGRKILFTVGNDTIVNADQSRQIALKEIIESFCEKIEFSSGDIAKRFYPLGKEKSVIVDPHHQFGQPVVEKTNILAQTLYELYTAGETKKFISRLYDLNMEDIDSAIELFQKSAA